MAQIGAFTALAICYCVQVQAGTVLELSSHYKIPVVGLGTHGLNDEKLENILMPALESGLRHIDTAFNYGNEEAIGKVLKKWFAKGGTREDIFITSKFPYFDNRPASVEKYLKLSLERLGLQYIDMYLIHAPFGVKHKEGSYDLAKNEDGTVVLDSETDHIAVWTEMEKQVKAGRARSIGLSNFNETQITRILKEATIQPSDLQIEVHIYHQQKPLREFCRKHGIVVTGYAPIGSPEARKQFRVEQNETDFPNPLKHPTVNEIARNHNKSSAQILSRHSVQAGLVVIPGSKTLDHLKSNLDIFNFELTEAEMKKLDALDKGEDGKIFDYKFLKGIEKHPQYPFARWK